MRAVVGLRPPELPNGKTEVLTSGGLQVESIPADFQFRYRNSNPVFDRYLVPVVGVPDFASAGLGFDRQVEVLFVKEMFLANTHAADIQIPKGPALVHCVQLAALRRARIELPAQAALETGLAVNGLVEAVYVVRPKEPEAPDGTGLILGMFNVDMDTDVGLWHLGVVGVADGTKQHLAAFPFLNGASARRDAPGPEYFNAYIGGLQTVLAARGRSKSFSGDKTKAC